MTSVAYASKTLEGFTAQVDGLIENAALNAGAVPIKERKGIISRQRYANGETQRGRCSVTVIERFMGEKLVLQYFRLGNYSSWAGEDAPDSEELDQTFSYIIAVDHLAGTVTADFHSGDEAGFRDHLENSREISADLDFSIERPIEPSELEEVASLLAQVTARP